MCRTGLNRTEPWPAAPRRLTLGTPPDDRFEFRPLIVGFAAPVAFLLIRAFPDEGGKLSPVFFLGYIAVLLFLGWSILVALSKSVVCVARWQWRKCASMLILPLFVAMATPSAADWLRVIIHAGDVIHLQLMRDDYLSQIARLPPSSGPRLAYFI